MKLDDDFDIIFKTFQVNFGIVTLAAYIEKCLCTLRSISTNQKFDTIRYVSGAH